MDCASCGTPLRPTDHFCRKCGAPAVEGSAPASPAGTGAACEACGASMGAGDEVCSSCGTARPPSPPADVVSHITASATTRGFCSSCGAPLIMDGRFCKACGAPVPGAEAGLQCAACGTSLPPDAAFCGICGTPVPREAATVPVTSIPVPEPQVSGSWFSRHRLPVIIGLIAIVVAAIAAVAIFVVPGLSEPEPEQSGVVTAVASFWPDLIKKQQAFHDSVRDIRPVRTANDKGATIAEATKLHIDTARQAGQDTLKVISTAQSSLKSTTTTTPQEAAAKDALVKALTDHKAFILAIKNLPRNALDLKTGDVSQAKRAATAAQTDYSALGEKFLALKEPYRLPGEIMLTGNSVERLRETAQRMAAERVFVSFLKDANEVLLKASPGQVDLNDGIDATNALASSSADRNPDTAEPYQALDYFSSAMQNRQDVLDAVDSLTVPDDKRAVEIAQLLQTTFQSSETALERWAEWSQDVADRFTRYALVGDKYKGLTGKSTSEFDSYGTASSADSTAGGLQEQLSNMMNRYNKLYGLPNKNWSPSNM